MGKYLVGEKPKKLVVTEIRRPEPEAVLILRAKQEVELSDQEFADIVEKNLVPKGYLTALSVEKEKDKDPKPKAPKEPKAPVKELVKEPEVEPVVEPAVTNKVPVDTKTANAASLEEFLNKPDDKAAGK